MWEGSECLLAVVKMSHSFVQSCYWINVQVSHHYGWKTCQNGRLNIKFSSHLQAIRNRDCWVFWKHRRIGCNLKQFDGLTWLTPTPIFYATGYILTVLHNYSRRCARRCGPQRRRRAKTKGKSRLPTISEIDGTSTRIGHVEDATDRTSLSAFHSATEGLIT